MPIPIRSWLFTPGTRPERFISAERSGADVMILDLEDSVAEADKVSARTAVLTYLKTRPITGPSRAARINRISTVAENNKGVGVVDGLMIDEAVARKARRVLAASDRSPR